MVQEMTTSGEPGVEDLLKRAFETHGQEAVAFLILAKSKLCDDEYKELIKTVQEIVKRSSSKEGGITAKKCEEILSEVFVGQTHVLKGFHNFLEGRDPFHDHDDMQAIEGAFSFLVKVKASPRISSEDYNDLLASLTQYMVTKTMQVDELYRKVKRAMRQCPEFIETFETYLPDGLRAQLLNEQSCRSPKTSPTDKTDVCFTPDANHSLDGNRMKATNMKCNVSQVGYPHDQDHGETEYNFRQRRTQGIHGSFQTPTKGSGESLHSEEYKGDKIDPLPDWSPSRENELPPKVNLDTCKRCTTSYYLLPKNCLTLKSSYRTELGQSIFNDTLVSATSGREDCFKFRTKNCYEENIFKCEDDMFESDMLLQRYKATAEFIRNLQDHVYNDMKIQEHLTPLHRRCIEQLYDEHGLEMLDALWEKIDTSTALAILHSRLNQKIDDLSEARLCLNSTCSTIIANDYHRSLDHRSSSFKQLDKRRMRPKALLAEAREINMAKLKNGDKHLYFACNHQSSLISKNVLKDTDLHIHKDIDRMVDCASNSCPSEQKLMMIWTKLVLPFVFINCQLPESKGTVAPREACELCGLRKTFLRRTPDTSFANNTPSSSKRDEYHVNTSNNKSASLHEACQTEIEEGEFIPDVGSVQLGSMLGPWNRAASYDVAAPTEDGSSFRCPDNSICDRSNKSEVHHESREGCNVEIGSLSNSKVTVEQHDVKDAIPCCSLAVLLRLHQILYERLLVAKLLSGEARAKAPSRGSRTCDVYAGFKKELFNLLAGSTDGSNFEKYCLTFLGPRSYVLFTLNEVISRVIKQLSKICPGAEDNSFLQPTEKVRGLDPSKELSRHQNARNSPACPTNGSLEQDREEGEKGSNPLDDTVKPMQNHFRRRKKRKLETGVASTTQLGGEGSNS